MKNGKLPSIVMSPYGVDTTLPAERGEANSLNILKGKLRLYRHEMTSIPTAPVAPTIPTFLSLNSDMLQDLALAATQSCQTNPAIHEGHQYLLPFIHVLPS